MSTAFRQPTRRRTAPPPPARSHRPMGAPLYPVPSSGSLSRGTAVAAIHPRQNPTLTPLPTATRSSSRSSVRQLPTHRPLPLWLRWLVRVQRGSMVVTFVLAIAALVVYSSTVYTQNLWSKEYRKLKTLQRSERQLVAAGEVLKNQLAQQAERPGSGLVPKSPDSSLYLPPSPPRPLLDTATVTPPPAPPSDSPVGY